MRSTIFSATSAVGKSSATMGMGRVDRGAGAVRVAIFVRVPAGLECGLNSAFQGERSAQFVQRAHTVPFAPSLQILDELLGKPRLLHGGRADRNQRRTCNHIL